MGRIFRSNIPQQRISELPTQDDEVKKFLENNPIVFVDNIPGTRYSQILSGLHFKDKDVVPTIIYEDRGGLGGGPRELFDLFSNPNSYLYWPNIVLNVSENLIASGILASLVKIYKKLKDSGVKKRVRIVHFERLTSKYRYYEFPPGTKQKEFVEGVRSIPRNSTKQGKMKYFFWVLDQKRWVSEDFD